MSGESSSAAELSGLLTPAHPSDGLVIRADDPRLGEIVAVWDGELSALSAGRPVILGFPQDEGIRRNSGRPGSALAPGIIRRWLYRLTPFDAQTETDLGAVRLLDMGDLIVDEDLEASQANLGRTVAELLRRGCVPIVLGGGHETAFGTYLGYAEAGIDVAVINLDAHLDVRPLLDGKGHAGSPFRQMMEHAARPLPGSRYACLGAEPSATSRNHVAYVRERGGQIAWASDVEGCLKDAFTEVRDRLTAEGCGIHVSLDADVVWVADVPGVSAPAPLGLTGEEVAGWARSVGADRGVKSFELVEINPRHDVDDRSARWAAVVIWQFLAGLASRQ